MYRSITLRHAAAAASCVALTSCSSVQPVAYTGIASSSYLTANTRDDAFRVPYRYINEAIWGSYNSIIIDPIVIYRGSDNQFAGMSEPDKIILAKYMHEEFSNKLKARFRIVAESAQKTLHLKLTLTGAMTNTSFISPFTHIDMGGNVINAVQAIRGREGLVSGSVIYAVEISDAATDRLLSAYVTKQYPNAMNIPASIGALAASKTGIDKGTDMLVAELR